MTHREDIARIAKILARSTSSEPHEADTALRAAYKRMRRDHVDLRQLLTLPLQELYQESLTKLVTLILDEQPALSPAERRQAFQNYMALINARFAAGSGAADGARRAQQQRNEEEEEARQAAAQKARSEAEMRKRQEEFRQREQAFRQREEALRQREQAMRGSRPQAPPHTAGSAGPAQGASAQAQQHPHQQQQQRKTPGPHEGPTAAQTAALQKKTAAGWGGIASLLLLCVAMVVVAKYQKADSLAERTRPSAAASPALGSSAARTPRSSLPAQAVAAPKANLRTKASVSSKIKAVLKRGDAVVVQGMQGAFLEVQLQSNGQVGFLSRELVIAWDDFQRLQRTSAQQYIALRAPEKRVELLFEQSERQKDAFLGAVYSLSNGGMTIAEHLKKMQRVQAFDIAADAPASTWFALSATAARTAGDREQTMLEALAAIEADPVHLPHHVAFAWDNYRAERYEVVKAIGNFLPKLAPASSDAWMLFGFANGLTPNSSNTLTEAAFVLALQLSTNPEATRRHFRELTVSPYHPHIRKMLDAALADGRARPGLLKSVQRL